MGFLNNQFKLVIGAKLIDVEKEEDGVSGCGEEYTLYFDNGQEISIYVHPDTGLTVEED